MNLFTKFDRDMKISGLAPYDYVDGRNFLQKLAVTFCFAATLLGWMTIFGLALILK